MYEAAASILRKINDFPPIRYIHDFMTRRIYPTLGMYRDPYTPRLASRFQVAAVSVSLAIFLYITLSYFLPGSLLVDSLFATLTLAVLATAWFGGFWAGVVAIAFSNIAFVLLLGFTPSLTILIEDLLVRVVTFILIDFFVCFLVATLIRSRVEYEEVHRQLEAEKRNLDAAHRKIVRVLDSVSDIFISLDNSGRFIYVNRAAEQLFNRPRLELTGKTMWQEFPPQSFDNNFYDHFREVLKKGQPLSFELYFKRFRKWFMVRMYPAANAVSVYFAEITARKKEEQKKDEFISLASHELRVPVTTLQLLSDLLRDRLEQIPDQELQEYADDMHRQVSELVALVVDLLDASRLEQDSMTLDKKPFLLDKLMTDVCKNLEFIFGSHKIEVDPGEPTTVVGDENRIRQVLTNLTTNAIHYSPGAEVVKICKRESLTEVIVEVQDFGPGVPAKIQKKIFERFYHTNSPHSHLHHGLGLGLYLSKQIVELHGGRIWVESEEGKGAKFYFSLPKTT